MYTVNSYRKNSLLGKLKKKKKKKPTSLTPPQYNDFTVKTGLRSTTYYVVGKTKEGPGQ